MATKRFRREWKAVLRMAVTSRLDARRRAAHLAPGASTDSAAAPVIAAPIVRVVVLVMTPLDTFVFFRVVNKLARKYFAFDGPLRWRRPLLCPV